jgi:hypothetical protein
MQVLAILFFLTVLTGAALGLWRTVRNDMPLILAALGYTAPAPGRSLITAFA